MQRWRSPTARPRYLTPPHAPRSPRLSRWVLLWLLGLDLRVTILALPPLLPTVSKALRLDQTAIGAITNLPVLLFGVASFLGSVVIGRLGTRRAVAVGLVVAGVGGALRGVAPLTAVLFACTFVMGLGIAVLQPALPTLARQLKPESVGMATAVYGNGLLVGEALAASLTLPVVLRLTGSWEASLALWSCPLALTILLAVVVERRQAAPAPAPAPAPARARAEAAPAPAPATTAESEESPHLLWPNWRDGRIWKFGLIQGGASTVYFAANAFLPGYLHAIGHGGLVGATLTALNVSQLPASILLYVYSRRLIGRRWPLVALTGVLLVSVAGLFVASAPVLLVLVAIIGFTTAFLLLLTLALPASAASPGEVAALSAGMFTVGYSLAFLLPLLGGVASDATGSIRVTLAPALLGAGLAAAGALRRTATGLAPAQG
ncbi:MAG: CynX/NimT family MFS transporter [Acidimicrobiales bacterium]